MKDSITLKDDNFKFSVNSVKSIQEKLLHPAISNVYIEHYKDSELKETREIHNIVTNVGLTEVAKFIGGIGTTAAFTYMAVGTGSTAAAATQTALVTSVAQQADSSETLSTTNVSNDTVTFVNTFSFTTTYALREAGIFNAATGGTMLARTVFGTVTVSNGSEFKITWKIVT